MAIHTDGIKLKIYMGSKKIKAVFAGGVKVYSAGNICTYHVDGVTYQETVDEGESVLSPASFTIPEKSGYTFAGWSLKSGGEVLMSLTMGDEPIMLYAVWLGNPHSFAPLNGVNWEETHPNGGGAFGRTISADKIEIEAKKTLGNNAYGRLTAKIPTGGCRKVRISWNSSYGKGENKINGNVVHTVNDYMDGNVTFECTGDYITIWIQAQDGTAYWTSRIAITQIYFFN